MEHLITLLGVILGVVLCVEYAARNADKQSATIYSRGSRNAQGFFRDSLAHRQGLLTPRDESPLVRGNTEQLSQPPRRPDPVRPDHAQYSVAYPTWGVERREITYSPGRSIDQLQMRKGNNDTKALIGRWRRSIVGLVKRAEINLQAARQLLTTKDHPAAVQAACAGVENASRALIHGYGDKPDLEPGQEEPLRLLSLKIEYAEKADFEKIIDDIVAIRKHSADQQISEATAQSTVESASKAVKLFTQMIRERCMTEIPELKDVCPKCAAIDISTWYFNENVAIQQCYICHYKWHELRTSRPHD